MPSLTLAALCVTLLPFPQETRPARTRHHDRARVAGEVQGKDGKPWAKAEVIFRRRSTLGSPATSSRIDVTAKTDARGRFVARVPLGRDLSVWARSSDPNKPGRFSRVIHSFRPSRERIRLVEAASRSVTVHLQPVGADNWKAFGKIAFEIEHPSGAWLRLARDEAGAWTIPPMPGTTARLFLLVGEKVRANWSISLTKLRREQVRKRLERERAGVTGKPITGLPDIAKQPLPPPDVARLVLPPPVRLRLRVVAKGVKAAEPSLLDRLFGKSSKKATNDSGTGIAGATVSVTTQGCLRNPSTTTDAKGYATVIVPCPVDSWARATRSSSQDAQISVIAKGRQAVVIGSRRAPVIDPTKVRDGHAPERTIELPPGRELRGRIVLPEGWTQADVRLLARLPLWQLRGRPTARLALLTLDDKGAFRAAGLGRDIDGIRIVLSLRRSLPGIQAQAIDLTVPTNHSDGDVDLGTIHLSKLRTVALKLTLPDGQPAAYAQLSLARSTSNWDRFFSGGVDVFGNYAPQADRRGRCSLLTHGRSRETFIVHYNDHYLIERLTPKQLAHGPLQLVLKPIPHAVGRVLSPAGKPVLGATVRHVSSSWSNGDWSTDLAARLNHEIMTATTDASGRFRLPVIPNKALHCGVVASKTTGRTNATSGELEFATTNPPQDAELTMDDPAAKK